MAKNKNNKKEAKRVKITAREEQQGKQVVNAIFGVLVALALAFLLYATIGMN